VTRRAKIPGVVFTCNEQYHWTKVLFYTMLLIMVVSLAVPGIHLLLKTPEAGNDALDPRNYGIKITCISTAPPPGSLPTAGKSSPAAVPATRRYPPSRFRGSYKILFCLYALSFAVIKLRRFLRFLDFLHAGFEGLHQVDHFAGTLGLRGDDFLAGDLGLNELTQLYLVFIVETPPGLLFPIE
jgi:hypothetical protein